MQEKSKNLITGWFIFIIAVLGIFTMLMFSIGYLTDPLGVFSFMEPVFRVVGGGFIQALETVSQFLGVEFLSSLSTQFVGNVLTATTLVAAAIIVPYFTRWVLIASISTNETPLPHVAHYLREMKAGDRIRITQLSNSATNTYQVNLPFEATVVNPNSNSTNPYEHRTIALNIDGDEDSCIYLREDDIKDLVKLENKIELEPEHLAPAQLNLKAGDHILIKFVTNLSRDYEATVVTPPFSGDFGRKKITLEIKSKSYTFRLDELEIKKIEPFDGLFSKRSKDDSKSASETLPASPKPSKHSSSSSSE